MNQVILESKAPYMESELGNLGVTKFLTQRVNQVT
ncbi:hypothetical protein BsWGS_03755 [Bradybaena similaris]